MECESTATTSIHAVLEVAFRLESFGLRHRRYRGAAEERSIRL